MNIRKLFETYDVEPDRFTEAHRTLRIPFMLISQFLWFIFCYYNFTLDFQGALGMDKLIYALIYGFGGLVVYYILYIIVSFIVYLILSNLPYRLLFIVLGIIGTYFAFKIL